MVGSALSRGDVGRMELTAYFLHRSGSVPGRPVTVAADLVSRDVTNARCLEPCRRSCVTCAVVDLFCVRYIGPRQATDDACTRHADPRMSGGLDASLVRSSGSRQTVRNYTGN